MGNESINHSGLNKEGLPNKNIMFEKKMFLFGSLPSHTFRLGVLYAA